MDYTKLFIILVIGFYLTFATIASFVYYKKRKQVFQSFVCAIDYFAFVANAIGYFVKNDVEYLWWCVAFAFLIISNLLTPMILNFYKNEKKDIDKKD